ncbi:ubiquitin-conjugating enzyme/RWD-like protein [Trichophaea hybrida]|nr:ubiquitin-conjugating enzyme/RWD-like protein [Trichophaea hybrida]
MSSTASSSTSTAARRLLHELKQYETSSNTSVARLGPITDTDLLHWEAILLGPPGTPYEGCKWNIDIKIPERYPGVPPIMTFKTPCCHPNVHLKTGEICLDLLRGTAWTPAYTISTTLEAICHLLAQPEPDSPLNVDVAAVLRNGDDVGYESLVRVWGVMFAGKPPTLGR